MFKTLITLARGQSHAAAQSVADTNAMILLDQQMRDACANGERARRALAIARAQSSHEAERIAGLRARVADFEARAVAALEGGREDLAGEAAEAIAALENEAAAAEAAQNRFAKECARLARLTAEAERRLSELETGRRAARAAEAVRRLRSQGAPALGGGSSALQDAEATLRRLRERQREDEAVADELETVSRQGGVEDLRDRLEDAGFGDATKSSAAAILARLRQRRRPQA